jgi:hypothetical protein
VLWAGLAAADLFTVEVLTLAGLRLCSVLFIIELETRRDASHKRSIRMNLGVY